jgi:hypothetical protein
MGFAFSRPLSDCGTLRQWRLTSNVSIATSSSLRLVLYHYCFYQSATFHAT